MAFYQDIATAILRMEVVIRLEAMQAQAEADSRGRQGGAAGRHRTRIRIGQRNLASAVLGVAASRPCRPERRPAARWSTPKLRTIGYGLAAVACIAGAITFLNNGHIGKIYASAPAQLAANLVETPTEIQVARP